MTVMTNGGDSCEQKQQPISCTDVPFYLTSDSQKKKDNGESNSPSSSTTKTIVTNPISETTPATTTANQADISNCKLDGSADGIQQKFDIAKYQSCELHTNNDKICYDGFIAGCMQVGNTKLICEAVANSNILNIDTQTLTTIPQSTQAIQPAATN
jgi:hypothetical protein